MKDCETIFQCPSPRTTAFMVNEHAILECSNCNQRFTELNVNLNNHISSIYSDAYFFEGKDGYPNYLEEREILIHHGISYAKLISKYNTAGKILDVGCAAGFILNGFQMNNWECYGIEPNRTMADYGRNELNLNIEVGNLESYQSNERFDLITLIQVIGHFYDIDAALKNVAKFLKPGGLVLVESWNRSSTVAKIFGKYWHEYSPPSVIHWFSDETLIDLFRQYNFRLLGKGYPKKQINLKHAFSLIEGKTPRFPGKNKLFGFISDKFGKMKVYYPPLDLKWYLFQL